MEKEKEREKLIIVEGPRGVGKTTITNWLRDQLSYTNLFRMCGNPYVGIVGLTKTVRMYQNLREYIKTMEGCSMNLLFDRTFITEQAYNYLGVKDYDFTPFYKKNLMGLFNLDFDIYLIFLHIEKEEIMKERLHKDKCAYLRIPYTLENCLQQHRAYYRVISELKDSKLKSNVHLIELATDDEDCWQERLAQLFNINKEGL